MKNSNNGHANSNKTRAALADATSGVVASLISTLFIYPMDSYKTQVQAETSNSSVTSNTKDTSKQKLQKKKLYSGLSMKLGHVICSNFAYFFLYSWLTPKKKGGSFQKLWTSALAAMLNTFLTLPLDVISSRQQVQKHHRPSPTTTVNTSTNQQVENEEKKEETQGYYNENANGVPSNLNNHPLSSPSSHWKNNYHKITDLWSGIFPSLLLCTNPSIHYTVYESLKDTILASQQNRQELTMPQAFRLGFVAKFIATIVTYPLIRAKVILMTTSANKAPTTSAKDNENNNNIIQKNTLKSTLQHIFRTQGWKGFYKGCSLQLLLTIFKSALLMMFRERITNMTRKLILPRT